MFKKDLRLNFIALREKMAEEAILNASLSIANQLLKMQIWDADYYHIFLSIPEKKEIDTSFILSILQGKDKHVVLPKVYQKQILKHYLLTDSTKLQESPWGIPEPVDGIEIDASKIDIVFIPLLAFDAKGFRVGYGKGFYDRFLSECRTNVIKIGLSLFGATANISDVTEHDLRLDYCVTPEKIYSFKSE